MPTSSNLPQQVPSPSTERGDRAAAAAPTGSSGAESTWHDQLLDGTHVIIRSLHDADAGLEKSFIEHLSARSNRFRFLGLVGHPSDELIRGLTHLDFAREVAFAALIHRDGEKQIIVVSRFSVGNDGKACECAVVVADEWQKKGLATLLMRHLIDVARVRGIHEMVSLDAIDNSEMRELAVFLGFTRRSDPLDATQVVHSLRL